MNRGTRPSSGSSPAGRADRRPRYPSLLEIDALAWVLRLSQEAGWSIKLDQIDDSTLDGFASQGFDWIWLMGVWRRSVASRAVSRSNQVWRVEFEGALPDLADADICGSSFAIAAYEVEEALGGNAALAEFRARLAQRGLRLMLDFVPNHTALDHAWVHTNPDFYVQGNEDALAAMPERYRRVETDRGARILAHGRDPNFPGWPDTLQLNYANPALQEAQMSALASVSELCDGLRCDMAMLLLPEVFQRSWGLSPAPFWAGAIAAVRQSHPDFTFLAEAYWDLEWDLQQQGFDYCYDKRLTDRLRNGDPGAIRAHLGASLDYQDRLARFLENHDEPRAAAAFAWPQHQAAAVLAYFAPGLRLFQDGQFDGARVRLPTHLCRRPIEPRYQHAANFYDRLLAALKGGDAFRNGTWSLIPPQPAWAGNPTSNEFIAYTWCAGENLSHVVVVNYSDHQAQCYLPIPFAAPSGNPLRLIDEMGSETYDRDGKTLVNPGLYVDLGPWGHNLFRLESLKPSI